MLMKKVRLFMACLLMIASASAFAQSVTVKGVVKDASNGEPLAGAAVVLKGNPTSYALTATDGAYTLVADRQGVLVISDMGYKTQEVAVNGRVAIDVALEPDAEFLDEVVVTAQGLTRKQKAIGYSAQTLSDDQLTMTHSSEMGNSLAGKIAGAQLWTGGGTTFDEGTIILRGTTSYDDARGNAPIYVIDGVIASAAAINMDDVESINVLKGPSATALYGSRGGNGAVIVTTKKAQEGRSVVEFSHTTAAEVYYEHMKLNMLYGGGSMAADVTALAYEEGADAHDYTSAEYLFSDYLLGDGTYTMDYLHDENWGPRFDGKTMVRPAVAFYTDHAKYDKAEPWQGNLNLRDLTQIGWTNTTNIAFSKATKGLSARVAFTNVDRRGVMLNSDAVRRSLSIATTIKPNKWLTADVSYRYRYRRNHNGAVEGYSAVGNVVCDLQQWGQTNVNLKDLKEYSTKDTDWWTTWNIKSPTNLEPNYHNNPYATMELYNTTTTNNYHIISADVYATLPANVKIGIRANNYINARYYEQKRGFNFSQDGNEPFYRTYQTQDDDFTAQGYVTWADQFFDNRLSVEAAGFVEGRQYHYHYLNSYTNGGLSVPDFYNVAASISTYKTNNEDQHFKTRSAFANATLGWDDFVFVDGSIRYDLDSRLPAANNGYLYGGGSLSFMLSKLIKAPWLNFWKVRGSVAQVGSTIGAYNIIPTYEVSNKVHNVPAMYEPSTQKNPNIKPTISTSFEVGTEFKLFQNRLWGDVNLYRKDSRNNIIEADVVPQTGYATRIVNAGLVRNQGIEVLLGAAPIRTKDVEWTLTANFARNQNTLVELAPELGLNAYTIYWTRFFYEFYEEAQEGRPIGILRTACRFKRNEDGKYVLAKGNNTWGEYQPILDDTLGDEIGNVQPKFTGGFSTSLRVKNFTLGASLDYLVGGKFFSWTNMWGEGSGLAASTAAVNPKGVNEREPVPCGGGVYIEGVDENNNPVSGYIDAYNWYHDKSSYDLDAYAYDRTYVKLREVSLRYNFNRSFLQNLNWGISDASIALVATNPWLIYSACPNVDPSEISGADYNYIEGGQALSTRSFGLTLNVTF